jgi:hypothetical protein
MANDLFLHVISVQAHGRWVSYLRPARVHSAILSDAAAGLPSTRVHLSADIRENLREPDMPAKGNQDLCRRCCAYLHTVWRRQVITKAHLAVMRHATGLDRSESAYRNNFCADALHPKLPLIKELVAEGLMDEACKINDGRDTVYIVTAKGAALILPPAEGKVGAQ